MVVAFHFSGCVPCRRAPSVTQSHLIHDAYARALGTSTSVCIYSNRKFRSSCLFEEYKRYDSTYTGPYQSPSEPNQSSISRLPPTPPPSLSKRLPRPQTPTRRLVNRPRCYRSKGVSLTRHIGVQGSPLTISLHLARFYGPYSTISERASRGFAVSPAAATV